MEEYDYSLPRCPFCLFTPIDLSCACSLEKSSGVGRGRVVTSLWGNTGTTTLMQ
jgi:hypothetical protein